MLNHSIGGSRTHDSTDQSESFAIGGRITLKNNVTKRVHQKKQTNFQDMFLFFFLGLRVWLLNLAEILASRRQLLCSGPISTRSSQLSSLQSSIRFDPPALWMAGRESKLQAPLVMLMVSS
ncbi:hypothetical protein RRG08_011960 [Elysia crispata]|uniref:Uncharacterized protein n=1 Tax=Elysia crispata TaxID=231223 RepID=A0AAE1CVJ0_9GAST|nr:hypothetical protein RRG08_011960 [Elysia crispata]